MARFTLIGSASAAGIPVYGCSCRACLRAQRYPQLRRQKTSAILTIHGKQLVFDASAEYFQTKFPYGSYDAILLTHFHMDHVSALFDIRWGVGDTIPVLHPVDATGAGDLFKHPGILDFQPLSPFKPFRWQGASITPVPLNHSRPTLGYVIDYNGKRLAYLTDSAWLPKETLGFLLRNPISQLYLDTSYPPQDKPPRNHHDVQQAKQLFEILNPDKMGLLHLSHDVVNWAHQNSIFFDKHFYLTHDGDYFTFNLE